MKYDTPKFIIVLIFYKTMIIMFVNCMTVQNINNIIIVLI